MNRPGTSDTEECSVSRQERGGGGGEGGMDNVRPSRSATSANPTAGPATAAREGNTEEDWKIYEILCKDSLKDNLRDSVASNTQSFQVSSSITFMFSYHSGFPQSGNTGKYVAGTFKKLGKTGECHRKFIKSPLFALEWV